MNVIFWAVQHTDEGTYVVNTKDESFSPEI